MNATKTMRAGVVGWPIGQSLSPAMHGYWISEYGLNAEYLPLAVSPEEFPAAILSLAAKGYRGVNVTIPHKEAAYKLSATLDEDARVTGAVNLLIFEDQKTHGKKIHGRNTDVLGFSSALKEALGDEAARRGPCVVLGAGGAARAIIVALVRSGAEEIRILNRTRARATATAASLGSSQLKIFDWGDWHAAFADAGLLVNTTSLGMTGKNKLDISLDALPVTAGVSDIVYNPLQTELLGAALARGQRTMDGLGMLMHQAVPAFEAWFGVRPIVSAALRANLEAKLNG
nr:MAG: shikimate dehydrogenase [Hyphomicrobiales bacterium]